MRCRIMPSIMPTGRKKALSLAVSGIVSVARHAETIATGIANGMLEGIMKRSDENFLTVSSGALNGNFTQHSVKAETQHSEAEA